MGTTGAAKGMPHELPPERLRNTFGQYCTTLKRVAQYQAMNSFMAFFFVVLDDVGDDLWQFVGVVDDVLVGQQAGSVEPLT